MAVSLNKSGARHAQALIREGKTVADERDDWSEHQPSAEDENRFIERHGMAEYGKPAPWHRRREIRPDKGALQIPLLCKRRRGAKVATRESRGCCIEAI